jgi:hypothetical protein
MSRKIDGSHAFDYPNPDERRLVMTTATQMINANCAHCTGNVPVNPGAFCCDARELEALRSLMEEVTRNLDSEVVVPATLGDVNDATAFSMLRHTRARIKRVLGR